MNEMLKKHLRRLIKDHDKLSAQLKDATLSSTQRRVAGKVLVQVDATINFRPPDIAGSAGGRF